MPPRSKAKAITPAVEAVEGRRLMAVTGLTARPHAAAVSPSGAVDPGAVAGVTDPSVIKQGETYYVFSSGPGIEVRSSPDLAHWRIVGQVFDAVPAWALAKVP